MDLVPRHEIRVYYLTIIRVGIRIKNDGASLEKSIDVVVQVR
jgi:hypothetical protein